MRPRRAPDPGEGRGAYDGPQQDPGARRGPAADAGPPDAGLLRVEGDPRVIGRLKDRLRFERTTDSSARASGTRDGG